MFKKISIVVTVLSIIALTGEWAFNDTSNQPPGYTEAPSDLGGCGDAACHNTAPYAGGFNCISIEVKTSPINPPITQYVINTQYFVLLNHNTLVGPSSVIGFQVTALDPSGNMAGNFTVISSSGSQATEISNQGGREYMSHKSATGSNAWAFRWNSPASYVGDITFYITTISADSSVTPSGDTYCVSTLAIQGLQQPVSINADFSANNTSVCSGDTVIFTDNSSGTVTSWAWDFGTGATPASETGQGPHSVVYSGSGLATVSLIASDTGNTDTETKVDYITINATPIANAGPDTSVCEGESVTLTASGGGTYLWSNGDASESTTVSPLIDSTFSVTVSNSGCTDVDDVFVEVYSLPVVNVPDQSYCPGSSTTLDAGASFSSYLWSNGDTTQTIVVSTANTYIVTVTASSGCTASDSSVVTQSSSLNINLNDTSLCSGSTLDLDAGNPGATYLWNTGDTTQVITVDTVGTYIVVVDLAGCIGSDTAEVTLSAGLVVSINDTTVCEGDPVVLDAGYPGGSYLWSTGETTQTITPDSADTYYVAVDFDGCQGADSAIVTVLLGATADAGTDQQVCEGDNTTIGTTPIINVVYSWNPTTGLADSTAGQTLAYPATTTTYILSAMDSTGCGNTDTVTVTVNPVPIVSLSMGSTTFCELDTSSYLLIGIPTGGTFSGPGVSGNKFVPKDAGPGVFDLEYSYTDTATNCTGTDTLSVIVNVLPVAQIINIPDTLCVNDSAFIPIGLPVGGTFFLTGFGPISIIDPSLVGGGIYQIIYIVNNGGVCIDSAIMLVTVIEVPVSFTGLNPTYCDDDAASYTLTPTPTGGTFIGAGIVGNTFNPLAAGAGTYDIVYEFIEPNSGCTFADTQSVTVSGITINYDTVDICVGGAVTLVASGGLTYLWSTGSTNDSITVGPSTATTYWVTGLATGGCLSSDTVLVNVTPPPPAQIFGLEQTYCSNEPIDTLLGSPLGGLFSGPGISGNTFNPQIVAIGIPLIIKYKYSGNFGCADSTFKVTTVNLSPSASISGLANEYCNTTDAVEMLGLPPGGFFTGAGVSDSTFVPFYAGADTHNISYIIVGQNGCYGVATEEVVVHEIPNVNLFLPATVVCENNGPVTIVGFPQGGTYSGIGVSTGIFDPAIAGTGGPFKITYTYTDSFSCTNYDEKLILVNSVPNASFSGLSPEYCINAPIVNLIGSPVGGTFIGTGVSGNTFNPAVAGLGAQQIAFTYTDSSTGCFVTIVRQTIVNRVDSITGITLAPTYCQNDDIDIISGFPLGGTFSGPGMVVNAFNPAIAGSGGPYAITYDYINTFGCFSTYQQNVTVYNVPVITISPLQSIYCLLDEPVALSAMPTGGTFTGAGVTDTIFDPAAAGVGEHVLEYEALNLNNCVSRKQVTVNVHDCVGVEEFTKDFKLDIYPNPFKEELTIEWNSLHSETVSISVRNILGQIMLEENINAKQGLNTYSITNKADLNRGIYFIELSNGKTTAIKKVVKAQ